MAAHRNKDIDPTAGLLHDCVAPYLFISRHQLEMLINSLDENTLTDRQQTMLIKSRRALESGQQALRAIINRQPETDEEALYPTVRQVLATYAPLLTFGKMPPPSNPLMADIQLGICLSELLANVYKHAPGADVRVNLEASQTHKKLEVESAGANAPILPQTGGTGLGLRFLEQRARKFGGEVKHHKTPEGFLSKVKLPAGD